MTEQLRRKRHAKVLRFFRKVHRITGLFLFIFFLCISISGILLAWKKHSNGLILSDTYTGTSTDFKEWLPMETLQHYAYNTMKKTGLYNPSSTLKRIDVRIHKGIVKFVFSNYYGIQIDGATGAVLHIEKRYADLLEDIHDGSILDHWIGTDNGILKRVYATIMGGSLLVFCITGFWLWYGPKRMKKLKKTI
ncbi:PepSY domain-containing protein [Aquimarina hainanensis]|uniref:PepSY domain-containing protein n=1 Tax=Aquimarina hainanensis TaxID=1578017 RepID=A0ABW5NDB0_9FLAO